MEGRGGGGVCLGGVRVWEGGIGDWDKEGGWMGM